MGHEPFQEFKSSLKEQKYLVVVWQALSIRLVTPDRSLLSRSPRNQRAGSIYHWLQRVQKNSMGAELELQDAVSGEWLWLRCVQQLASEWFSCKPSAWVFRAARTGTLRISDSVFSLKECKVVRMYVLLGEDLEAENNRLQNLFWDREQEVSLKCWTSYISAYVDDDGKNSKTSGYLWIFGASKQVYLISSRRCICHIRGGYRDLLQGSVCQTLEPSVATWTQQLWSESSVTAVPEALGCCWIAWHLPAVCVSLGTLCWGGWSALTRALFTRHVLALIYMKARVLSCCASVSSCEDTFWGVAQGSSYHNIDTPSLLF